LKLSAKADYAIRAATEMAVAYPAPMKGERIATAQDIPQKFLENIMLELKHEGLVIAIRGRGPDGGYHLAMPPEKISLADVIRAVEGPLANIRGVRPEQIEYTGAAVPLKSVWIAVRANLRAVLERVSLADVARGELPPLVSNLTSDPDAWLAR
jgi:Rrf2 family protein